MVGVQIIIRNGECRDEVTAIPIDFPSVQQAHNYVNPWKIWGGAVLCRSFFFCL